MIWLVFSVINALSISIVELFRKKALSHVNEYVVTWFLWAFLVPFYLIMLFFTGIPEIGPNFWWAVLGASVIGPGGMILYTKGVKESDLSIVAPMLAFTPLLLLITSPIILGEFPSALGIGGIVMIVLGSYVLNIKERSKGYLEPLKALVKERGPRYALAAAFIWGIGANFDKVGIQNSSIFFYMFTISLIGTFVILLMMRSKIRDNLKTIPGNFKKLLPVVIFGGISGLSQMMALKLAIVPYVISVKRSGILFAVLIGHFVFNEEGIKERLLGAIIMFLGLLLIAFS